MANSSDTPFLADVDPDTVTQELWKGLNSMYSRISHLVNYKYHLILYRLAKGGRIYKEVNENGRAIRKEVAIPPVPMDVLTHATGYSRQRLHKIISEFERREIERQHHHARS